MTDLIASSATETDTNTQFVLSGSVITKPGTLISGQNLAAFTTVGRIAASSKLTKAVDTAVDGSDVVIGILVHATDASGGDTACQYYAGGRFNKDLVVWDASYTAAEQLVELDRTPIVLESPRA